MPKTLKYFRDKEKARIYRNNQRKRNYDQTIKALNRFQRWTDEEKELIIKSEKTDRELHLIIGRSTRAIQSMRCLIKKRRNKNEQKIKP